MAFVASNERFALIFRHKSAYLPYTIEIASRVKNICTPIPYFNTFRGSVAPAKFTLTAPGVIGG